MNRESFLISVDKEMKKWLTAADTWREIKEGLQEWFEQAGNILEAVPAIDTDEDDMDDEDSDTDRITIASMQSRMARRTTTTMKDSRIPNPKYLHPMNGLTSFEDISTRVGLIAKKSFIGNQDTTPRSSQASNVHPR
jgi:hypothetical protein